MQTIRTNAPTVMNRALFRNFGAIRGAARVWRIAAATSPIRRVIDCHIGSRSQ